LSQINFADELDASFCNMLDEDYSVMLWTTETSITASAHIVYFYLYILIVSFGFLFFVNHLSNCKTSEASFDEVLIVLIVLHFFGLLIWYCNV